MDWETYKKKGNFLLERFEKEYPIANNLLEKFIKQSEEAWKKLGVLYGEPDKGFFGFDDKGAFYGSIGFYILLGMLADTIFNTFAEQTMKTEDYKIFLNDVIKIARKEATKTAEGVAIKSMNFKADISPITCRECGHLNPISSKFCNECGNPL